MREEIERLIAKLRALAAPARGAHEEAAAAAADLDANTALVARLQRCLTDLHDVDDDPDLHAVVKDEVGACASDVEALERSGKLVTRFFKQVDTNRGKVPVADRTPILPDVVHDYRTQAPTWAVRFLDLRHPKAWLTLEGASTVEALLQRLAVLESKTWTEVDALPHAHSWEGWDGWEKTSRDRLHELTLDDRDGWYQLPTGNMGRVFGFRVGSVLNLVWWDRDHDVYKPRR
ncbi:MAG: hypothetical protein HYS27_11840 [Deltaproteobacteria bacterium]|nr:hypothetical protein [Deltaproteobacteria bacterium]